MKIITTIALLLWGLSAVTQNTTVPGEIFEEIGSKRENIWEEFILSMPCPFDSSIQLYVVPEIVKGGADSGWIEADIHVISAAPNKNKAAAHLVMKNALMSDAVALNSFFIDTSFTEISPTNNAFHLVASHSTRSWDNMSHVSLWLIGLVDQKLVLLLNDYTFTQISERNGRSGCYHNSDSYSSIYAPNKTQIVNSYYPMLEEITKSKIRYFDCDSIAIDKDSTFTNKLIFVDGKYQYEGKLLNKWRWQ